MSQLFLKLAVATGLWVLTVLGGLASAIPLKMDNRGGGAWMVACTCFAGGAFMGLTLLHILPEAHTRLHNVDSSFPLSFALCGLGIAVSVVVNVVWQHVADFRASVSRASRRMVSRSSFHFSFVSDDADEENQRGTSAGIPTTTTSPQTLLTTPQHRRLSDSDHADEQNTSPSLGFADNDDLQLHQSQPTTPSSAPATRLLRHAFTAGHRTPGFSLLRTQSRFTEDTPISTMQHQQPGPNATLLGLLAASENARRGSFTSTVTPLPTPLPHDDNTTHQLNSTSTPNESRSSNFSAAGAGCWTAPSILLQLALWTHSILEGTLLGASHSPQTTLRNAVANAVHKTVICFSLAVILQQQQMQQQYHQLHGAGMRFRDRGAGMSMVPPASTSRAIIAYATTTLFGTMLSMLGPWLQVRASVMVVVVALSCFGGGVLLFVAVGDVLRSHFVGVVFTDTLSGTFDTSQRHRPQRKAYVGVVCGFLLMLTLAVWDHAYSSTSVEL